MDAIASVNLINCINTIVEEHVTVRRRKMYKQRVDLFSLRDNDFKTKYRFSKDTTRYIIDMVREELQLDCRGSGTSAQLQVLVALRWWGRREAQDDSGDLIGLSQPSVSRICARVSRALARCAPQIIKMPTHIMEQENVMGEFKSIRNFPGVIGAIDCTHIKIKKCGGSLSQYYINRKGYYSLNVQAVCDARLRIRNVVVRWRRSTHDSRIFNESSLKMRFESGEFKGHLFGDSGYQLQSYLFTPILRPQSEKDEKYNEAHIATRNSIERCFGIWKHRFRCLLSGLTVSLQNAKNVIVALAVLHNISLQMNDSDPEEFEVGEGGTVQNEAEANP